MNKISSFISSIVNAGQKAASDKMPADHQVEAAETQMTPEQELAIRMPEMIANDCFMLMVQPVVNLETSKVIGGEALSRLIHPERGMIYPDKFLPALDEAGLYVQFDYYIFRKTCDMVNRLFSQGVTVKYLSCNFSRITLSEVGVADRLAKIADECGVAHNNVAVEITEQQLETDNTLFRQNLKLIKDHGFRIFVDDLGSGFTSVRDLWSYHVDVEKIDRSLLLEADTEEGRMAYRGLRNLATVLGCEVLCEGVETEDQHQFVQDVGCHYCQGYFFYRPMEEEKFVELLIREAQE